MSETGRPSAPVTPPAPPPASASAFARMWRGLLPAGLAVMAAAAGFGVFDTTSASAWIFVVGVVITLAGVASLAGHLFDLGRREIRELEQRLEDELDKRGNGRT